MPKKKNNKKKEDGEKKGNLKKEQIKNCKQYLDLDLSSKSAGGLLPYKLILDSLSQALELKDQTDESSTNKLREIFLSVSNTNIDLKISNINKKLEKPLQQDLDKANEVFNASHKRCEDKRKFHNLLVEKGNKLQEDRNEMINRYEKERQDLVKESEDYVKGLQAKTDPKDPERKKIIDENQRLKNEIQKFIDEGMKMKDDFDKQLKEGSFDIKSFEEKSKLDFQNTIESFQQKAQGGILLNTSLKTELLQLKKRNEELEKFQKMANEQYNKLQQEIKNKIDESIRISTENIEMQNRITESQNNKEELLKLMKEQQSVMKKLNMMRSLNDKYTDQYEELTGEKLKKKKKKKNKNKKNKKKVNTSSTTESTTEHEHDHCGCGHDHGPDNASDSGEEEEKEEPHGCCCGHDHHH
jgi:hypothetical protein